MSPKSELYAVTLNIVRIAMKAAQRFEMAMVRTKVYLIAKIHGEQARHGW